MKNPEIQAATVTSTIGGPGSTFHFTARFSLRTEDAAAERSAIRNLRSALPVGLPVLVVDDNTTNRRILEEMLTHWLMMPQAVEGGQAALRALERARRAGKPFPLMLLDAHMPEMDGFALAEIIQGTPNLTGATIMMLSSAGQPGDVARCRELGIAAYLTKPIRQSELFEAILNLLGAQAEEKSKTQLVTLPAPRETGARYHILLAEDNAVNQRLAVRLLEKHGHSVVVAGNGHEAVAAFDQEAFDLILMDVQMPELNGYEAATAIRKKEKETGRHIPIIALTAHAMKGDDERCLKAGMDGYLPKPIRAKELFETIEFTVAFVWGECSCRNRHPSECDDQRKRG